MIEGLTGITKSSHTGDDLISREQAIDAVVWVLDSLVSTDAVDTDTDTDTDVVEVVRCKDCVYSEAMNTTGLVYCNEIKTACSEEGYCYIGERRGR